MPFNFFQKFGWRKSGAPKKSFSDKSKRDAADLKHRVLNKKDETNHSVSVPAVAVVGKGKAEYASLIKLLPHISEKATALQNDQKAVHNSGLSYVFRVSKDATKQSLKKAIESRYDVEVQLVRVSNVRGKMRKRGAIMGKQPGYKKAIATLSKEHRIDEW